MKKRQTEYDEIKLNLIKKSLEKAAEDVQIPVERRKGDDGILNFINFICFTLWFVILSVFMVLAKLDGELTYQGRLFDRAVGSRSEEYLSLALLLTIICFGICTFAIVLNFTRNRRRRDRIKTPLIIYETVSFIIGVFLILKLY